MLVGGTAKRFLGYYPNFLKILAGLDILSHLLREVKQSARHLWDIGDFGRRSDLSFGVVVILYILVTQS